MRLVMHVETDFGEMLTDAVAIWVPDDLLRGFKDFEQDRFGEDAARLAARLYVEAAGK